MTNKTQKLSNDDQKENINYYRSCFLLKTVIQSDMYSEYIPNNNSWLYPETQLIKIKQTK